MSLAEKTSPPYEFSNNWFAHAKPVWSQILAQLRPVKMLEVGSYEGQSACFLIETQGAQNTCELHCIDTWEGGIEHDGAQMPLVEQRFLKNTKAACQAASHHVDLHIHKSRSDFALAQLFVQGYEAYFDFIYIDGSHQAPDVLADAVLAFRLLRVGGIMAFDDYLWAENLPGGPDLIRMPKPAIDAFINLHFRQLRVLPAPQRQIYVEKL